MNVRFVLALAVLLIQVSCHRRKKEHGLNRTIKGMKKGANKRIMGTKKVGTNRIMGVTRVRNRTKFRLKRVSNHAMMATKRGASNDIKWENAMKSFRELCIKDFLQGDFTNISNDNWNNSLTIWLLNVIQSKEPGTLSEWDKRVSKQSARSAETLQDENLKQLVGDINSIMKVMSKAKKQVFTKADLNIIKTVYPNFFPQTYKDVNFTVRWTDVMTKYIVIVAAGYIDLMKSGTYDECKLAELLNMFKPHIIEAAKKLAKARYQGLDTVGWSGGDKRYKRTASLTIRDRATERYFQEIPLSQMKARIFTPLALQMADFMMKNLADKLNALYNDNWISDSCNLASPITIDDLEFEFPESCYDADGQCKLPCGKYGANYTWCPTNTVNNKWASNSRSKYWVECTPTDWDKCMYIEQLKPVVWSGGYSKLKRRIEGNMLEDDKQGSVQTLHDDATVTSSNVKQEGTEGAFNEDDRKELADAIAKNIILYRSIDESTSTSNSTE